MKRSSSIAWRLALAFAAVCALVLSVIGVFLYRSLAGEIAYRDDLALLGRLEQVRALLQDSDSLDALQARPGCTRTCWATRKACCWCCGPMARR
ncbi:hypothetical protein PBOI14_02510 [Pseudomonas sp. Boi14]|nr:hypothetical protein PBOI14_02510 [Pseudomonas sp. Boi14]